MHRRKFIGLAAFAAPAAVVAADGEKPPVDDWWAKTEKVTKFTAHSPDRTLVLTVELTTPPLDEITEAKNDAGELTGYQWKTKRMPSNFVPGENLLTKLHLEWDGKHVPVPEKYWADLACLEIQHCTIHPKDIPVKFAHQFSLFLADLRQPRILLSLDGGTALIEWVRPEDCDSSSTFRWMLNRAGTVLRHRYGSDGC